MKNNFLQIAAIMAISQDPIFYDERSKYNKKPETRTIESEPILKMSEERKAELAGMKKFQYGDVVIFAINRKKC